MTVSFVGIAFARFSRRIEQVQWANQTIVNRRLDVFKNLAPGLNQLLCFGTFVGGWKEITPGQAVATKRELDEVMYANKVLFSDDLFCAYRQFMASLFEMYISANNDAQLRTPIKSQWGNRRSMPWWVEDEMVKMFCTFNPASTTSIQSAYNFLANSFRSDLYITSQVQALLPTGHP